MKLVAILTSSVLLFAQLSYVKACRCLPITLKGAYYSSSTASVVHATPISTFSIGPYRFFRLNVQNVFKGCRRIVLIRTPKSSCGVPLEIEGSSYLLTLPSGQYPSLTLCNFYRKWEDLTEEEVDFLNMRQVCCNGNCKCPGSNIVSCKVPPCQFAESPCPEGTQCMDNYCGGCFAEWFTDDNQYACVA